MIRFILVLLAMLISCIVGPYLLWIDYQNGDWFLMSVDVAIIVLWAEWLWRQFKAANRDW
jgi:hypothetical protein